MTNQLSIFPSHSPVFIDANIFLYFLLKDEKYFSSCEEFLLRVEEGEIIGFTDTMAISETIFLYVKTHLIARHNLRPDKFLSFAKAHPQEISKIDIGIPLKLFTTDTLRIVDPPQHILLEHLPRMHSFGMLPNDTFHLLTMDYLNLINIATNDKDFQTINHIQVWSTLL